MNYSKSQLKAIHHMNGPCLILAVPGSGKTTVLLARIHNLIEKGVNPNSILAMTFSKSQALDMEQRYFDKYGKNGPKFSTIHSFSFGIVRSFSNKHIKLIESSKEFNKFNIVSQIYFRHRHKKITDENLETFFRVSSFLKNTLMSYDEYKKMYQKAFNGFLDVFNDYEKFKKDHGLIDFDDMLLEALRILQTNKKALEYVQNRFDYIQIDEGQDTSYVQLKIISLIAKPNNNLFIVADDDQSIYGFRGASSKQLLDFPNIYLDAKIYFMQENYRSTENISEISNKLIKNNKNRYEKFIKATNEKGSMINLNKAKTTYSQASHVIKNALDDISRGENVAILYRNNISSINLIEQMPKNIDFYIKDGKLAFYSNQIIIDIIDTINFSKDQYDVQLFEKIYYKFNLFLRKDFVNQIKYMPNEQSVIKRLLQVDGLNSFFKDKIYDLSFNLDKLSDMDFDKAISYIIFSMDYYEYLEELSRRNSMSMISFDRIIDTLLNISKGIKTVKEFQNKVNYLIELQKSHSINTSNLTLSTIHGAKGLEFDNVYIIDMIEHEFPSSYSSSQDEETMILEEERRLFYVALTRAKKNLNIYYPKILYLSETKKSMFIDEILDD